ncbi:MAG: acyltransferase [Sphingomonas sp.]|nr:acyltransferase [Sphingomonas sp.]
MGRFELMTVRGLACVALVAYHVVGPTQDNGMHLPLNSSWHLAMNSLDFLRMPMFTVLSGFLYASQRADSHSLPQFYRKKVNRLVLPLVFVTTIIFILRMRVYHDSTTYIEALFFHYEHLWFVQALILIFAGMGAWDAFRRPSWVELCVAGFAAVMISRTFQITTFFSLNGACYLLPFFVAGMILRMYRAQLKTADLTTIAIAVVAIVILMQQASNAFGGNEISRTSVPAALCGICGTYLMLVHCPRMRLAEFVGRYSYSIFLWHSVAASGARHLLRAHTQLPNAVEFSLLLAVGLYGPILLHRLVGPVPILSLLALGVRASGRKPHHVAAANATTHPAPAQISDVGRGRR